MKTLPEFYTDKDILDRMERLIYELRDNLNKKGNLPNYLYIKDMVTELKTLAGQTNLDVDDMYRMYIGE